MSSVFQLGEQWFPHRGGGADRYFHGLLQALAKIDPEHYRGAVFSHQAEGAPLSPNVVSLGSSDQSLRGRFGAVKRWAAAEQAAERQMADGSWQLAEGREVRKSGGQEVGIRQTPSHLPTFPPSPLPTAFATHFALYDWPIRRLLKRHRHIVHFHGPWALESAAEGARPWTVWMKRALERSVYRTGDHFICLSEAFKAILVSEYRIPGERISVIPGGIETAAFTVQASRPEARARLGWEADTPTVICVRRLARRMGLENLLKAFAGVLAEIPDARLKIGGKGPLSETLMKQCADLGIAHAVELLGFIPDEDLPSAYRAADVSIVPSESLEGFGLITLESLAAGTPVLVTPVGGLPETVSKLDKQLILSDASPNGLCAGMHRALAAPSSLPSAQTCREYVQRHFDWKHISRQVVERYHSTCAQSRGIE